EDRSFWKLAGARAALAKEKNWQRFVQPYLYRPFDQVWLFAMKPFVHRLRLKVMQHLQRPNIAMCVGRAGLVTSGPWDLVFCTKYMCDHNIFYRGSSTNFPLYLYEDGKSVDLFLENETRRPNLSSGFTKALASKLNIRFVTSAHGDLKRTVGALDVFHYVYAILHSPTYRSRYAAFLRRDFPVIPLTKDVKLFNALVGKGQELTDLHTMGSSKLSAAVTAFPVAGSNIVTRVKYEPDQARVYINDKQFFEGIPSDIWQMTIGGFPICGQWLKDRKEQTLSYDDIQKYQQIIVALREMSRVMDEIDDIIPSWPLE
ncbi:MAG: type ISP restriction/modification enzyme, partial [bacterium]|nr:type ISP restriction/modification enzyme [bacterium]